MCCESCPKYEQCAIDGQIKERCCQACPDYNVCFGKDGDFGDIWEEEE